MLFLSTYPVRGTTQTAGRGCADTNISIHVPRAGYDVFEFRGTQQEAPISIHVPRAGYDLEYGESSYPAYAFLSTYPVRGTTRRIRRDAKAGKISIHVPRAGYDANITSEWQRGKCISIHVPRAGYDASHVVGLRRQRHFYPRTPCGVRLYCSHISHVLYIFLSTYPVRGTTCVLPLPGVPEMQFLSTYPVRGTTRLT